MVRTSLLLLFLFASTVPGIAQSKRYASPPAGIAWESDFTAALKKARELDKPLMVFFTMNEQANEEIARNHLRRQDIIRESRNFVCLVSCPGEHAPESGRGKSQQDGSVCGRFGCITCKDHVKIEQEARDTLLGTSRVDCPQFLWLAPDGKSVLMKHVWMLPAKELRDKMRKAHKLSRARKNRGARDPRVMNAISEASHRNMSKRRSALSGLVTMDDESVVAFMEKKTGDRMPKLQRLEAIMAMGESAQERFLPILHAALSSKDSATRSHAAVALEKIGSPDSGPLLIRALRKERKEDARCNLLRGLSVCGEDAMILEGVKILLKKSSRTDRMCGLYVAANLAPDSDLTKTITRHARGSQQQVRAAAFFAIGSQGLSDLMPLLKRRLSSERNLTGDCCRWALSALGAGEYEGDDPQELIANLLPDPHLRRGDLEERRPRRRGSR